ncbi:hypothetical protein C8J56DRAFT_963325 [Mycena floridula]|nr:hypothetical protein C8J56DRAFT_963325 [Mycena floridula]
MDCPPPPMAIIRVEDLAVHRNAPLGARSGSVFQGRLNGELVAVKILSSEILPEALMPRVALWQSFNHANVHVVLGISPEANPPFLVTEPCIVHGNLRQYLMRNPNMDRPGTAFQVALGMQYLHKQGIVHGSLKPSNILVKDDGQVCVADYGIIELQSSSSTDAHRYFSPEAWKGTTSCPSDVFAFAMTALEIFTSKSPWGILAENLIYKLVVQQDSRPDRPDPGYSLRVGLTNAIWGILEESWHKEPRLRPSFDIIIRLWGAQDDSASSASASDPNIPRTTHLSGSSIQSGPPAYDDGFPQPSDIVNEGPYLTPPRLARNLSGEPGYDSPNSGSTIQPPSRRDTMSPPHSAPVLSSFNTRAEPWRSPAVRRVNSMSAPTSPFPPQSSPFHQQFRSQTMPLEPVHEAGALGTFSPPLATFSRTQRTGHAPRVMRRPGTAGDGRPSTASSGRPSTAGEDRAPSPSLISPSDSSSGSSNSNALHSPQPITPQGRSPMSPVEILTPSPRDHSWGPRIQARRVTSTPQLKSNDPFTSLKQDIPGMPPLPPRSDSLGRNERSDSRNETVLQWEEGQRRMTARQSSMRMVRYPPDQLSIQTDSFGSGEQHSIGTLNPTLLVGALQSDVKEGQDLDAIDNHLAKIQFLVSQSEKEAEKLVTAGVVPTLIHLLKTRAADGEGLDIILITLGYIAHDSISANTVYRTNTVATLIEIFNAALTPEILTLVLWCINRICRNGEISAGLIKQNLVRLLVHKGLPGTFATPAMSAYCLGTLAHSDSIAEALSDMGVIPALVDFLRRCTESQDLRLEEICSSLYAMARISRSIKLAKSFAKAGCIPLVAHHLNRSEDPQILDMAARVVGCLMRPNSSDMAKLLLDAGIANGLARLPSVLSPEEVGPLASFAFAIQRFSCAEWGSGTRKALVDVGVVDSLLAALRTAADEPYPQVHIDLALAVSFLGDVGGSSIRKEIMNAGGIVILRRVGEAGNPEVAKACGMAVTSITGNIWTRNTGLCQYTCFFLSDSF